MAVRLPCFRALVTISFKRRVSQPPPVRAQSFREEEEGRSSSSDLVDANLSVLRKKIDEVKMKERLERCCRSKLGWNHATSGCYNIPKQRKDAETSFFELLLFVCRNIGLTIAACAFFLCLASIFIHLSQLHDHFL